MMTYEQHGFGHADRREQASGPVTSTTRYLSGAAYVDEKYAETVVDEMVAQSHRAVVPTLGYDLVTIIRHCFRAQRIWLAQNAMITAILLLGVILLTGPVITLYLICLVLNLFTAETPWRQRWATWKAVVVAFLALSVVWFLVYTLPQILELIDSPSTTYGSDGEQTDGGGAVAFLVGLVVVALALLAVVAWARNRTIVAITSDLEGDRGAVRMAVESRAVEQRIGVVGDAQHGNVVLHAGYDPFVGAGRRVHAWSIATELRPDDPGEARSNGHVPRVAVDPVELVGHLRHRLAAMRGRDLPAHERIAGLQLRDQVIASGTRWFDYPLIDDASRLPYSVADRDAVEAIIRSPQTSARHFLRVTVGAPDQAAVGADGRTIMPAEHQSVVTSTYLHVAIEGGMLYVELVSYVLGPIRQHYLDIDALDGTDDHWRMAVSAAVRRFGGDVAVAPVRLVRGLRRRLSLTRDIEQADRDAKTRRVYDFGARFDVRAAAALAGPANYLQWLDAEKYTRLIDRRATEAIHEYLTAHGVDTSDFAAKVNFYQNNNVSIQNAHGPVATGTNAQATSIGNPPAAAAAASRK